MVYQLNGVSYLKTTPLLNSFNWTLEKMSTPPSWSEAVITVNPKKGKSKALCSSYRPILGRQTQDNIRRSLHLIHNIKKRNLTAALVSLDAEKAFDCVNWEYLFLVLERFGFAEKSVNSIKALYSAPTARIKINGRLTDRIQLEKIRPSGILALSYPFCTLH